MRMKNWILVRIWRRRRLWMFSSIDCVTISCERRYFQLERYRECSVGASFEFSHERISGWTCCVWDVGWPHLPPSPVSTLHLSPLSFLMARQRKVWPPAASHRTCSGLLVRQNVPDTCITPTDHDRARY